MPSLAARLAVPAAALLLLLLLFAAPASAANFTCAARGATCQSAIGYADPNATTYAELVSRFGNTTTTLRGLLGANGLPADTAPGAPVRANATVLVPFRCRCAGDGGGVGQSDGGPVYVVQPQDGLDAIARRVFGGFVTYQEIAAANNITDANKIDVGQRLWIPLPCSCDQVDGADVMHLAYSVAGGDTTAGIAAKYGVSEPTLLKLNGITDPKSLLKGQILDVPLPVCHSSISSTSPDSNLLVPNGTYAFTAQDCIQCSCNINMYQLNCTSVQSKGCPAAPPCPGSLKLGQMNGTGCGSTMCAYSGYSNSTSLSIQTNLVANQTEECQKGGAARSEFAGSMWRMPVISIHMVLILICFL